MGKVAAHCLPEGSGIHADIILLLSRSQAALVALRGHCLGFLIQC